MARRRRVSEWDGGKTVAAAIGVASAAAVAGALVAKSREANRPKLGMGVYIQKITIDAASPAVIDQKAEFGGVPVLVLLPIGASVQSVYGLPPNISATPAGPDVAQPFISFTYQGPVSFTINWQTQLAEPHSTTVNLHS